WHVSKADSATIGAKKNSLYGADKLWFSSGNALRFTTPRVSNLSIKPGDVLTITATNPVGTHANAEFMPVPAVPTLYTQDGVILNNRRVEMLGKDITWNQPNLWHIYGATSVLSSALTNQIWGFTNMIIGSDGQFKLRTPGQVHNQVNPGMVLTMTTTDGDAEYQLP